MKKPAQQLIKALESDGWEVITFDKIECDGWNQYFAQLRKDQVGIYIEVDPEHITFRSKDIVCPNCNKDEIETAPYNVECPNCGAD